MNSTVAEITPVAQRLVKDYLAIKQGENFLIVTDTRTSSEIATALMEEAIALGCDAASIVITPRTRSGENPPPHCAAAMKAAQVIVAAASTSLYHTQAKAEAQQAGARGVLNAPFMAEAWANGAMTADFREIRPVAERLRDILKTGKTLRLTSPAGTELVASIEGRKPVGWLTALCREAGQISALPGGEVSLPPVEGTAEGRIVIEQVMSDLGRIEQPLELIVRGGNVIEVNGGAREQAERLNTILNTIPNARNIAEIGIGLNPKARLTDQITETKKRLGTAHIVVGDNARDYGGSVKCAVHLDGMILDVTIELDGKKIVEEGRTLLSDNLSGPEMITPYPGTRTSDLIERLRRVEGSGMRTAAELPLVAIESANGVFVTDPDGNRYLDLYAGFAAANIGHAHPRVTAAIQAQAAILTHVSSAYPTSTRAELLEKLLSLAPSGLTRGLFAITGGQANDLALRIARRATGRNEFIAFYGGYFGRDAGVLGLNSKAMFRRGLGIHPGAHFFPFPYAYRCPFGNQHSNPEECAQECLTFLESALRLFVGNDLPGVISARLVERLITEEGIAPGKRAVIWDTPGQSQAIASVMQGAGIEIVHHLQSGESILAAKGGKKSAL